MTIKEYAKSVGVEVVGNLKKKVVEKQRYNTATGNFEPEKEIYWIDEAGNEFIKNKKGICIITADGDVI